MSAASQAEERCVGEPVSWLRLEQLALGELRDGGAAERHLASCPACAAALAQLRGDARSLPPLVVPANAAGAAVRKADKAGREESLPWWRRGWRMGALGGGVVALAAALLLVLVRRGGSPEDDVQPGALLHVKGAGEVAVTLVRERDGVIAFDPSDVAAEDRWKVQLTCAQGGAVWADVAVLQDGLTSHPLSPQRLACGNEVVLPGAFRITGGGAELCVALDDKPPPRTRWRRGERRGTVCRQLVAARPRP